MSVSYGTLTVHSLYAGEHFATVSHEYIAGPKEGMMPLLRIWRHSRGEEKKLNTQVLDWAPSKSAVYMMQAAAKRAYLRNQQVKPGSQRPNTILEAHGLKAGTYQVSDVSTVYICGDPYLKLSVGTKYVAIKMVSMSAAIAVAETADRVTSVWQKPIWMPMSKVEEECEILSLS